MVWSFVYPSSYFIQEEADEVLLSQGIYNTQYVYNKDVKSVNFSVLYFQSIWFSVQVMDLEDFC